MNSTHSIKRTTVWCNFLKVNHIEVGTWTNDRNVKFISTRCYRAWDNVIGRMSQTGRDPNGTDCQDCHDNVRTPDRYE